MDGSFFFNSVCEVIQSAFLFVLVKIKTLFIVYSTGGTKFISRDSNESLTILGVKDTFGIDINGPSTVKGRT